MSKTRSFASSAPDTPAGPGTIVGKEAGVVNMPSNHSVDETVDRLQNILRSKEITLFAIIDHSGEAAKVGMEMPPTKLLIFGNPKGGTPLGMAKNFTAKLDRHEQPSFAAHSSRKRTSSDTTGISALCQKRPNVAQQNPCLFDHLVGGHKQPRWHRQAH